MPGPGAERSHSAWGRQRLGPSSSPGSHNRRTLIILTDSVPGHVQVQQPSATLRRFAEAQPEVWHCRHSVSVFNIAVWLMVKVLIIETSCIELNMWTAMCMLM